MRPRSLRKTYAPVVTLARVALLLALLPLEDALACGGAGNPGCGRGAASQGSPNTPTGAGNPFSVLSGNKYAEAQDYALPGSLSVEFTRHYNSLGQSASAFGIGWSHGFETRLTREGPAAGSANNQPVIRVVQGDGREIVFVPSGEAVDGVLRYVSKPAGFGVIEERVADVDRALRAQTTPELLRTISRDSNPWVWRWSDGRRITFNVQGLMQSISDPDGERLSLQHDARGRLSRVTDRAGRTMRLTYWDNAVESLARFERDSRATQAAGATGKLRALGLPDGNTVNYFYDSAGMLSLVRFSDGRELRYEYVSTRNGPRLAKALDRDRRVLARYEYDEQGFGKSTAQGEGINAVELFFRNAEKLGELNETWVKGARGQVTVYRWREGQHAQEWQLVEAFGPGCATCPTSNVRYRYDRHGLIDRIETLSDGAATERQRRVLRVQRFERDSLGRLTAKYDTDDNWRGELQERLVERYVYRSTDPLELPVLIERPSVNAGQLATLLFEYNARGQVTKLTENGFAPQIGSLGQFTRITRTTQFAYFEAADGRPALVGRLKSIDGPVPGASDVIRYEYDDRALLTAVVYPLGGNESYEYDELARLRRTTPRDGIPVTIEYDAQGRTTAFVRAGLRSSVSYDEQGRLASIADPVGQMFRFGYDSADRLTTIVDTDGFKVALELDLEGRPLARRLFNPDGSLSQEIKSTPEELLALDQGLAVRFSSPALRTALQLPGVSGYSSSADAALAPVRQNLSTDDAAPKETVTDERGLSSVYSYDDFGRLVRVDNPDSGPIWFLYDASNRLVARVGADGARTDYRYDAAGRPIQMIARDETTSIEYDARSQKPALIRYAAGYETFRYDEQHRIARRTRHIDGHEFVTRYRYDSAGRLSETVLPDGQVLQYRYNSAASPKPGVLNAILRKDLLGTTTIVSGINEASDRFDKQSSVFGNGLRFERELDSRGQITRYGTKGVAEFGFDSDDSGKITSAIANHRSAQGFSYDASGRVTGFGVRGTSQARAALGLAYDDADNVLAKTAGGRIERYAIDDYSNRIEYRIDADGSRTEYQYDAAGRTSTVGKRRYRYDGEGRLTQVFDGERLVGQYSYNAFGERIKKVAYNGARTSVTYYFYDGSKLIAEADGDGEISKQYVYLEDRPVAVLVDRDIYALHTDWRGAPLAATDQNRQVVWRAEVGLWHEAKVSLAKFELNLRGSNQYFDAESGLHYNYHRFFDPQAGRYLTPDPIGQEGGLNLYAFVEGDAANKIDRLGLNPQNPDGLPDDTSVAGWSLAERVGYMMRVAVPQMPDAIKKSLSDLVSPGMALAFGGIILFMISNPAGWVVSAVTILGAVAMAFFAYEIIAAVFRIAQRVFDAKCVRELVSAGQDLSKVTADTVSGVAVGWFGGRIMPGIARALRGAIDGARRLMARIGYRPPATPPRPPVAPSLTRLDDLVDSAGRAVSRFRAGLQYAWTRPSGGNQEIGEVFEGAVLRFIRGHHNPRYVVQPKHGGNNGFDIAYLRSDGRLVIVEAKGSKDQISSITAFGSNRAETLRKNLEVLEKRIRKDFDEDRISEEDFKNMMKQIKDKTFETELFTSSTSVVPASRLDVFFERLGRVVDRVIQIPEVLR